VAIPSAIAIYHRFPVVVPSVKVSVVVRRLVPAVTGEHAALVEAVEFAQVVAGVAM